MKKVSPSMLLSIFTCDKLTIKKIFTLFFIFLNIGLASSQDLSDFNIDTTLQVNKRAICGYNPSSLQSPFLRIASAGSPSQLLCPKALTQRQQFLTAVDSVCIMKIWL